MQPTFSLSRATKPMLQRRVTDLSRLYNEAARELNAVCDSTVPFTADDDIRKGDTVIVRVPRRFIVRNR
jgi:hypothetical protein